MGPLKGIKVLDLSRVLAGPYCTMMMADFGADVIKIEPPKVGDDSRAFTPFLGTESAYFMSLNRNKRSMSLDFKNPKHCEIFKEMVKQADVVVENYRPGTMEKFGLGWDVLKEINPRLIYAACSGFGRTGPYTKKPAYDVVVQAMGGIMSITGEKGGHPMRVGASVGDVFAGLFTCLGVMMALYHRVTSGKGQLVDVAMLDCQVAILENAVARYVCTGVAPGPIGNRHPSITPFADFTSKDGSIIARNMIVEVEHPVAGKLKVPGIPMKLSETPGEVLTPAPLLAADTNEIMKEFFGWDEATTKAKLGE